MNLFLYDLEATSPDPQKARIIQIAWQVCKWPSLEVIEQRSILIDPECNIPVEVTELTGIDNAKVQGQPVFEQVADHVLDSLSQCQMIGGYNSFQYDDVVLGRALAGCGHPDALQSKKVVDLYKIVRHYTPQSLEGMYRLVLGENLEDAHDAMVDVEATHRLLAAYMNLIILRLELEQLPDKIVAASMDGVVDRGGFLGKNDQGDIQFNVGKHRGKTLKQADEGYLRWIAGNSDFDQVIRDLVNQELQSRAGITPLGF